MASASSPLLVQLQLAKEKENKKTSEIQTLENIGKEVHKICCFGGDNYSGPKEIAKALQEFLQAHSQILGIFLADKTILSEAAKKESENLKLQIIEDTGTFFGISYDKLHQYFAIQGENLLMNPAAIPILLKHLFEICIEKEGSLRKDASLINAEALLNLKYTKDDLARVIGYLTHEWMKKVKSPKAFIAGKLDILATGSYYIMTKQQEPQAPTDRQKTLQYILNDVIHGAFCFGVGNCQVMAEVAFLLAIQSLQNTPIRYIQFLQKEGNLEELNAVVMGNWPKAGCRILAPWKNTEPFLWKESFNTPELQGYNTFKTFFTIKDEAERKSSLDLLEKGGFNPSTLLASNKRREYADYNDKICRKILAIAQKNHPSSNKKKVALTPDL